MTDFGPLRRALQTPIRRSKAPGLQYVAVDRSATLFACEEGAADLAGRRPMRADSTLMAYSMSKTITAAAVLQLVDRGAVGLDDPIARYLERLPYGQAVTVRQLLSHTSGIPNPIPLRWVHSAADASKFDEQAALSDVLERHRRLAFPPGTRYAYSNIGYWLLGRIVEQAAAEPFRSYVSTRILGRLGITPDQLSYAIVDPAKHASGYLEKYSLTNLVKAFVIDKSLIGGYEGRWLRIRDHYVNGPAFGGLVGSARGFGRFLQDQLGEHSVLFGDDTRALLMHPQSTTDGRTIPMTLGWHVARAKGASFLFKEGGGGGFHSMMRLYPKQGIGTVLMTNATGIDVAALLDEADQYLPRMPT